MKIYILIFGTKIKAYASLSRLCKEAGISKDWVRDNLPFQTENVKIEEIEVDERL